jgi:hypothetical protein
MIDDATDVWGDQASIFIMRMMASALEEGLTPGLRRKSKARGSLGVGAGHVEIDAVALWGCEWG